MTAARLPMRPMSPRRLTRIAVSYGILLLVTIVVSLPVFWFVVTTLKKDIEYLSYPIKIFPAVPQWDNYVKVFTTGGFSFTRYAGHSLFLAVTNTALIVLTSSMAGFAFSRLHGVPGRNALFMVVIALFIIPGSVYLIPQFIVYSRLRLTDTYWPWILGGLGASPFFIFMFRQFFATFPKELEDAAEVDGCGPFRVFWQIFLPNAKPALATAVIFNFGGVWGDYITPLIYLSDAKTTLSVKLAGSYMTPHGEPLTTVTLAANLVFALPLVIIFFLGQKYILKGVVTSGLKG